MAKQMTAQKISLLSGTIGLFAFTSSACSAASSTARCMTDALALGEEEEDEPEQGERLGERDAEEHRRPDRSGHLGLAGHRGDGVAHHDADADARADGGGTVDDAGTDGLEAVFQLSSLLARRLRGRACQSLLVLGV